VPLHFHASKKRGNMRIIESDSHFKHQQEWLNSCVDEEIIALNVKSLSGTTPYEYLLYSPKISRRNDGRLRDRDLKKYQHIELGGWWCNGIDPLNNYALMMWGCFKPDHPRRDRQKIHKFIKYEHPFREETRAFFLLVPNRIWVKVSNRSGIPITEEDLQHPGGFWHWVWRHNVPVTIVEGVKKAGALLTAGYAAFAIPGVNAGYRTPHDEYGNAIGKPSLIPDLKHFATQGRQVNICFDQDNKPETVQRVRTAISRMGRLLVNEGCSLRVIDLPFGQEKGVDDFIVAKGQPAFDALYNTAVALELWEIKLFTLLTYPLAIALNQRFLDHLLIPSGEKLIILKAPKGTGKTQWLSTEVAKAHDLGRRVLIITHRIQLGEALCDRFGVNYVTEVRTNETGTLLGYGVCVDSLHQESQARFNPNDWFNDVIIIDECDQVFWHLLNSGTEVQKRRVSVLKNLKQLVQNVLGSSQFQGVQPVNSVRQMLARVRETVDRHVWVREWGMGVVGNGSTTIGGLLRSQHVATQANIALLSAADNADLSYIDQNFQPESLQTWGKRGFVINVEMRCYRESVLAGLVEDGYTVIDADDVDDDESGAVIESVKAASEQLYTAECKAIADSPTISDAELKKLQDTRAKTKTERHQQRKAELSRRYEVDVTPDLVEKDDDGWYPQLRMHYYLTLGREFLTNRDAKRAKTQLEAGENSIWKPDFNKGQMLPSVLLLEELNLLQLLTPGERLRSSDENMLEFKVLAIQHRHVIKNYLNVSISEKLTPIAIAQKLLGKIDLKLNYVGRLGKRENRECVYQFVAPDDQRDSIFEQWLNRDEAFSRESVSVTNNISTTIPVIDTTPQDIPQTLTPVESSTVQGWKGLKLKLQQGLDSIGSSYNELINELISKVGEAVGVADGEPYWNGYLGQWQVWVNFATGCTSVVCDWLVAA
jgi:Domain of unknown function (DUF3854)